MFALLAIICFTLVIFDVTLGAVDLVALGLAFIAAQLLFVIPLDFWSGNRR